MSRHHRRIDGSCNHPTRSKLIQAGKFGVGPTPARESLICPARRGGAGYKYVIMLLKNLKNSKVVGTVLFLLACPCRMKVDLKQPYVFIQHNGTQVSNTVLKRKQAYLLKSQTCCPMVVKIRKHTEPSTSELDLDLMPPL